MKTTCKNSMAGEHKWRDQTVKHKNKPICCILCGRFKSDEEVT